MNTRPATVAFALGETVELKDDADVVGQQRDLDAAAQAAQPQCDYRLSQLGRAGDVARASNVTLTSSRLSGIGTSHFVPRTDAMGLVVQDVRPDTD